MPHLNRLRAKLHSKGFDLIAIDVTDAPKDVAKVWKQEKFTMQAGLNGDNTADKYKVSGVPTNYLVGKNGKILARYVGFDEAGIRGTLAKAGIK